MSGGASEAQRRELEAALDPLLNLLFRRYSLLKRWKRSRSSVYSWFSGLSLPQRVHAVTIQDELWVSLFKDMCTVYATKLGGCREACFSVLSLDDTLSVQRISKMRHKVRKPEFIFRKTPLGISKQFRNRLDALAQVNLDIEQEYLDASQEMIQEIRVCEDNKGLTITLDLLRNPETFIKFFDRLTLNNFLYEKPSADILSQVKSNGCFAQAHWLQSQGWYSLGMFFASRVELEIWKHYNFSKNTLSSVWRAEYNLIRFWSSIDQSKQCDLLAKMVKCLPGASQHKRSSHNYHNVLLKENNCDLSFDITDAVRFFEENSIKSLCELQSLVERKLCPLDLCLPPILLLVNSFENLYTDYRKAFFEVWRECLVQQVLDKVQKEKSEFSAMKQKQKQRKSKKKKTQVQSESETEIELELSLNSIEQDRKTTDVVSNINRGRNLAAAASRPIVNTDDSSEWTVISSGRRHNKKRPLSADVRGRKLPLPSPALQKQVSSSNQNTTPPLRSLSFSDDKESIDLRERRSSIRSLEDRKTIPKVKTYSDAAGTPKQPINYLSRLELEIKSLRQENAELKQMMQHMLFKLDKISEKVNNDEREKETPNTITSPPIQQPVYYLQPQHQHVLYTRPIVNVPVIPYGNVSSPPPQQPQRYLGTPMPHEWHGPEIVSTAINRSNPWMVQPETISRKNSSQSVISVTQSSRNNGPVVHVADRLSDILTTEIIKFQEYCTNKRKERRPAETAVLSLLNGVVKELWPRAKVKTFGSYETGLSLPDADVDLVIWLPNVMVDALPDTLAKCGPLEGRNAVNLTWQQNLEQSLRVSRWVDRDSIKIIHSRVPIIRLNSLRGNVQLDISFGDKNHYGIAASQLVKSLKMTYPPLEPLLLVLKKHLKERGLGDCYTGGLSSYALTLLVACFLKFHPRSSMNRSPSSKNQPNDSLTSASALTLSPEKYSRRPNNHRDLNKQVRIHAKIRTGNGGLKQQKENEYPSLGDLLVRFLKYHSDKRFFDPSKTGISLERGYFDRQTALAQEQLSISDSVSVPGTYLSNSNSRRRSFRVRDGLAFADSAGRNHGGVRPYHSVRYTTEYLHNLNGIPVVSSDQGFDPLYIEDPLQAGNNVGVTCFRIQTIQKIWGDTANTLCRAMFNDHDSVTDETLLNKIMSLDNCKNE